MGKFTLEQCLINIFELELWCTRCDSPNQKQHNSVFNPKNIRRQILVQMEFYFESNFNLVRYFLFHCRKFSEFVKLFVDTSVCLVSVCVNVDERDGKWLSMRMLLSFNVWLFVRITKRRISYYTSYGNFSTVRDEFAYSYYLGKARRYIDEWECLQYQRIIKALGLRNDVFHQWLWKKIRTDTIIMIRVKADAFYYIQDGNSTQNKYEPAICDFSRSTKQWAFECKVFLPKSLPWQH